VCYSTLKGLVSHHGIAGFCYCFYLTQDELIQCIAVTCKTVLQILQYILQLCCTVVLCCVVLCCVVLCCVVLCCVVLCCVVSCCVVL
jgi:hypothetical protein